MSYHELPRLRVVIAAVVCGVLAITAAPWALSALIAWGSR